MINLEIPMQEKPEPCQFYFGEVIRFSKSDNQGDLKRRCWRILQHHIAFTKFRYPFSALFQGHRLPGKIPAINSSLRLDLEPGDLVQVRSEEEILATLDKKGSLNGLYFMPAMRQYCGKTFKVYKKVRNIKLETTGQMRKIVTPTVFLEGSICNACDRSCYCFWREAWLKRVQQ